MSNNMFIIHSVKGIKKTVQSDRRENSFKHVSTQCVNATSVLTQMWIQQMGLLLVPVHYDWNGPLERC